MSTHFSFAYHRTTVTTFANKKTPIRQSIDLQPRVIIATCLLYTFVRDSYYNNPIDDKIIGPHISEEKSPYYKIVSDGLGLNCFS